MMTTLCDWNKLGNQIRENGITWNLLTVLEVDWNQNLVRRSYSSDELTYPSGGTKSLMQSDWAKQVIFEKQPFVSIDEDSFRHAFNDYPLLESLGLRFALNVPITQDGKTVQTVNLLRKSEPYTSNDLAIIEMQMKSLVNFN